MMKSFTETRCMVWILFFFLTTMNVKAQQVTQIWSNFDGFWTSSTTSINPVYPNNRHLLLAFQYSGTTYSTGIDDALLTSNSVTFTPSSWRAIPVPRAEGNRIMLGSLIDGLAGPGPTGRDNGPTNPFPAGQTPEQQAAWLTDGTKGLDLGTGLANVTSATPLRFTFSASGVNLAAVVDAIPDILITQLAQPSLDPLARDQFRIVDAGGITVGTAILVDQNSVTSLGTWNQDFYNEDSQSDDFFTDRTRDMRLIAFNLSDFGIDGTNYTDAVALEWSPTGDSDPVFFAFNEGSLAIASQLGFAPASTQPTNYISGTSVSPPNYEVQLQDAIGNPILEAGVTITASIFSGDGTLTGTVERLTNASGIATFDDLVITGTGSQTIRFNNASLDPLDSPALLPETFVWTAGAATANPDTGGNWNLGTPPPAGAFISVPEGSTPYPVFDRDIETGNLTIGDNATLTMSPSFGLTITSGFSITIGTGGLLILKSDATGTAYLGTMGGTCTVSGTVRAERYIMGSNRSFRFMGHPFNSALPLSSIGDVIDITGPGVGFTPTATMNPSAFYYDPSIGDADAVEDGGWRAFTAITDNWNQYQGIRVLVRGPKGQPSSLLDVEYTPTAVTFVWEGQINTCDQIIPLGFFSPSGGVSDFNLIGNPYPSAIDVKAITRSASVGSSFYVWQPRESISGISGRGGAYLTEPFGAGSPTYTLPMGGAFFVRAGAVGQTLTIEENDKVNSNELLQSVAGSTLRMDENQASKYGENSLQIILSSEGEWWDRSLIFFDQSSSGGSEDQSDATKLANPTVNFFSVSNDDFAMAIDSRPYQEANGEDDAANRIPLHILSPARSYTLTLPDFDMDEGRIVRLYDRYKEEYITLAKGISYDFEVTEDPTSKGHRFDIVMGVEVVTSTQPKSSRFRAFLMPNPAQEKVRVSIQTPDRLATTVVRIFSLAGLEVQSQVLSDGQSELDIDLGKLRKGIYLVEVTHGVERIVKRLIVN